MTQPEIYTIETDDLDSTNAFEGPEKLLELWFAPDAQHLPVNWPANGLRSLPHATIVALLDTVHCQILSQINSPNVDAYLLSESSLFVWPHKLILKTCGTTTTLAFLSPLQDAMNKHGLSFPLETIPRVFYSHRAFLFPHAQRGPHLSWASEISALHEHFPSETHAAHLLHDGVPSDAWHLYVNGQGFKDPTSKDLTVEILMTGLDTTLAEQYTTSDASHQEGTIQLHKSGLDKLLPYATSTDAFAFAPCGFSMNSVDSEGHYATVHVTPEPGWSYASVETNTLGNDDPNTRLSQLVDISLTAFSPKQFALVVCTEGDVPCLPAVAGYTRGEIVKQVEYGYELVHVVYRRN